MTPLDPRDQRIARRDLLEAGLALGALLVGPSRPAFAQHDNLGAARGRLPDTAMRRRMEALIDKA